MNHLAQEIIKAVTTLPGGTIENEAKHVRFTIEEFKRKRVEWLNTNESKIQAIADPRERFRYIMERVSMDDMKFTEYQFPHPRSIKASTSYYYDFDDIYSSIFKMFPEDQCVIMYYHDRDEGTAVLSLQVPKDLI